MPSRLARRIWGFLVRIPSGEGPVSSPGESPEHDVVDDAGSSDGTTPAADPVAEGPSEPETSVGLGHEPVIEDPDCSEQGLFTFGPEARLRPAPNKVAKQSPRALEHVPDIAMDWLDTTFAEVRALSARGHEHRYLGELRQDSFAIELTESHLVLAVADGVGGEPESHRGSAMAARDIVRAADVLEAITAAGSGIEVSLQRLAMELAYEARNNGLDPRQLATTLVLAIVSLSAADDGSREVVVAQIGDSTAWRHRSGEWQQLGEEEQGEVHNTAVDPLPLHSSARVWRETFRSGETLALVSDGVGNILHANASYRRELSAVWNEWAPAPGKLLQVVDATVKSFGDDRTLVGVRFR